MLVKHGGTAGGVGCAPSTLSAEDKELLNLYHHSFDDDKVDLELILCLIHHIHSASKEGECVLYGQF